MPLKMSLFKNHGCATGARCRACRWGQAGATLLRVLLREKRNRRLQFSKFLIRCLQMICNTRVIYFLASLFRFVFCFKTEESFRNQGQLVGSSPDDLDLLSGALSLAPRLTGWCNCGHFGCGAESSLWMVELLSSGQSSVPVPSEMAEGEEAAFEPRGFPQGRDLKAPANPITARVEWRDPKCP